MRRLALALLLSAAGCDAPAPERDPSVAITPLTLPDVSLQAADGAVALRGEGPTLLHFWATWCAPCRRELPRLLRLAEELEGARVLAVTDEPWSAVVAHFGDAPVPACIARDPGGQLARTLGVAALPDNYLVDDGGVARRRVPGSIDAASRAIRAWLSSSGDPR